ncbi:MAG: P-loop NTPase [Candidatus Aenigmatarchaeota archaeon]
MVFLTKTIAVVSGKGGVGKTVTAANLSLALQEFGEKVIAMDCDQAASNLALQLDLHPNPDKNLQQALSQERDVLDTISLHKTGLMVMPSSHAIREERIDPDKLKNIIDKVEGNVIIDSPPGLNDNVHTILGLADQILVVTNPEIPAVSDAVKVAEAARIKKGSDENIFTILTKSNEISKEVMESEIEMALELPIISNIPYDRDLKESIFEQTPIVRYSPYSKAAIEYRRLAAWMTNQQYEPPKMAPLKRMLNKVMGR